MSENKIVMSYPVIKEFFDVNQHFNYLKYYFIYYIKGRKSIILDTGFFKKSERLLCFEMTSFYPKKGGRII